LLTDIQRSLSDASEKQFAGVEHDTYETRDQGHGRDEYRSYLILHQTDGIRNAEAWSKFKFRRFWRVLAAGGPRNGGPKCDSV
jgi:hypothetical protein